MKLITQGKDNLVIFVIHDNYKIEGHMIYFTTSDDREYGYKNDFNEPVDIDTINLPDDLEVGNYFYKNGEFIKREEIENKQIIYTKADFQGKFFTDEGWYNIKTLTNIPNEYKFAVSKAYDGFMLMVENEVRLSDSRIYDMITLASSLGFTTDSSENILKGVDRHEKEL